MDFRETLEWCQTFNGHSSLQVFKLVCEDTVEDSLSIQALQKNLGMGLTRYSSHQNDQNVPQNVSFYKGYIFRKISMKILFEKFLICQG